MRKFVKRVGILVATIVAAGGCNQQSGGDSAKLLINGAGATFPAPIYQKWASEYAKVEPSVQINYQSMGSGAGQKQILAGTVDFGASDGPMTDEALASVKDNKILHIPTVAGADVVTYNLPGNPQLKLDGPILADIYLGRITNWNDPRIVALNPDAKLSATPIVVIHRSDGSGTTYIWADYLSSISQEWATKVGRATAVSWPTGLGGKGNEGVTAQVKQVPGAIGYVELAYAKENNMPYADIKNAHGEYVTPSIASVTKALATAQIPDDFRFSMVNPPGEGAYPIAGTTWLLVYQQQKDPAKGKKLVEFMTWAISHGEQMAETLDYAPLPQSVQQRVLERIKTIKY
jgi:phosphate transport system substrate-binding protein